MEDFVVFTSNSLSSLTYLAPILLWYYIIRKIYFRYKRELVDIPGPQIAAWTNLWRVYDAATGQSHQRAIKLHRKYGKLVRVGPNAISVSDPALIPKIYSSRGNFIKSAYYPLQSITYRKKVRPNAFSTRDEAMSRNLKRKMASAYTVDGLLKMEEGVDQCGDMLTKYLGKCADDGKSVDLGAWLHYYGLDVLGVFGFNEKLGFLETGSDVKAMIASQSIVMVYFNCCGQIPFLHKFLLGNPLLPYLIPNFEGANDILSLALEALNRRAKKSTDGEFCVKPEYEGNDMLSKWAGKRSRNQERMNEIELVVAISANIFAGNDTMSTALRATLYFLLKNPQIMQKAVREIDAASKAGNLSKAIADRESRIHLPYINVCIKEALRLHPPIGTILERIVPSEGAQISGKYVPGGTIVGINAWTIHQDADVFPSPETFKPERWLPEFTSSDHLARMERSMFSFGAGSRTCLGKNLSMMVMRKIVPRLLRDFEIELVDDGVWKVYNAFFTSQKMPMCVFRRR